MGFLNFNFVEDLPGLNALAMFFAGKALRDNKANSSVVFNVIRSAALPCRG